MATASGGLWKSVNRGITWTNLWEHMPVSTFGDLAIAPSNPAILYAGTGEQQNRQSTSWGNGGLQVRRRGRHVAAPRPGGDRHTGRVQVHPADPDIVYVAALGNLWRPSPDRGVYRSRDGGGSWEKVLYIDDDTGAVDLAIDPSDPDVLYAAMYQRQRRAWGFNGGGPGSGIHKTNRRRRHLARADQRTARGRQGTDRDRGRGVESACPERPGAARRRVGRLPQRGRRRELGRR